MNSLNKVLGIVVALMLAAFALPSAAAVTDKIFTVTASPTPLPAGVVTPVTLVFKNTSPGNSVINSLIINAPQVPGVTITKVVSVSSGTSSPPVGAAVSVTSVSVANLIGVKPTKDFTLVVWVSVPANATCQSATWLGKAFTGNSFNGDPFGPTVPGANTPAAAVGCDGLVACGGSLDQAATGTEVTDAKRASGNKSNNTFCDAIPYNFTNDIAASNSGRLQYFQTDAVFSYTVTFQAQFVNPDTGRLDSIPRVAWELKPDQTPNFIPGPLCTSINPPAKLTTISADNGGTLTVVAFTAPAVPFSIMARNERLLVTNVSGGTILTVARAQGGTFQDPNLNGAEAWSTPMPIVTNAAAGYTNKAAQMCIWDELVTPAGSDVCPAPNTDPTKICGKGQRRVKLFDSGDGWFSGGG